MKFLSVILLATLLLTACSGGPKTTGTPSNTLPTPVVGTTSVPDVPVTINAFLEKWKNEERPARAEFIYHAPKTEMIDATDGHGQSNFLYGYVAQAVEVEVDTETGQVRVVRVTSAHDVGKAVNPQMIEGQIEGGVMQALGYTITENFVTREGRVLTPYLNNYLMPGVLDIPERVDSIILEIPSEVGAYGIRGVAEMPYIPFAPAVIAAVHDATGVWFNEFPLTPWRVLEGLKREG